MSVFSMKEQKKLALEYRYKLCEKQMKDKEVLYDFVKCNYERSQSMFKVEVKPSKIHGLGLFATEDIKPKQLITFYPKHLHMTYGKVYFNTPAQYDKRNTSTLVNTYGLSVKNEGVYVGDPNIRCDKQYLGHFTNDSTMMQLPPNATEAESRQAKENYLIASLYTSNAATCRNYLIAAKPIKKGQEILITYGVSYWNRKNKKRN